MLYLLTQLSFAAAQSQMGGVEEECKTNPGGPQARFDETNPRATSACLKEGRAQSRHNPTESDTSLQRDPKWRASKKNTKRTQAANSVGLCQITPARIDQW